MLEIVQVSTDAHIEAVRDILDEYIKWTHTFMGDNLEDVPTFEALDDEFANLPGVFVPELGGAFLIANYDNQAAGCVALKKVDENTCELKRMYVRPKFRGKKIGWELARQVLDTARTLGYHKIVLDSHISMTKAHAIYEALGFERVSAPEDFPDFLKPQVVFMEVLLK